MAALTRQVSRRACGGAWLAAANPSASAKVSRLRGNRSSRLLQLPMAVTGAISQAVLAGFVRSGIATIPNFGSNPGGLGMSVYAPPRLRAGRPLIVVLHGCGQDAAHFATDAGWLALAQQRRLALLLPQQSYENHPGRCFNWYRPGDVRHGSGEAMSIWQMIRAAVKRFGSDPRQVFIVGFSAGGAMTAAMLAAYPALFAGGAIVAGFPVGCARSSLGAVLNMRHANVLRSAGRSLRMSAGPGDHAHEGPGRGCQSGRGRSTGPFTRATPRHWRRNGASYMATARSR